MDQIGRTKKHAGIVWSVLLAIDIIVSRAELILQLGEDVVGDRVIRPDQHGGNMIFVEKRKWIRHLACVKFVAEYRSIMGLVSISGEFLRKGPADKAPVF